MTLDLAGGRDVGLVRAGSANQDAWHVASNAPPALAAFAVADGVGGMPGGERASAAAIAAFAAHEVPDSDEDPAAALRAAIGEAAAAIAELAEESTGLEAASTTAVFAYASTERAWIANVGDSRAYHWHDGTLTQVSTDHSWVQEEVDAGRIDIDAARTHPRRNLITRALSARRGEGVAPDLFDLELAPGDRVLLCTDGLHGPVEDAAIEEILGRALSAADLAAALIAAALEAGGPDNVAVAVARVG